VSKRHVRDMMHVFEGLIEDASDTYPTLVGDFIRDKVRLRNFVDSRGIHAICVDMVAAGKHLDRCLDQGEYKLSGLPLTRRFSNRVVIPKFLRGLYLLVFDEAGTLKEDYDVQAIFFLRQILYLGRKASLACSDDAVQKEVKDFIVVDSSLPEPDGFWAEERPSTRDVCATYTGFRCSELYVKRAEAEEDPSKREELLTFLMNLDKISRYITSSLGIYDPSEWRFRHGPGATSERGGRFSNKYCWRNWSPTLENVFPIADYGFHNYSSWAGSVDGRAIGSSDPASRLISVWKTFAKPRLIAAEPSEHQWCQQNIWHYFRTRVAESWIGDCILFQDQSRNQELCRIGSRDGSYATVDLSAASDRVTCHCVGQYFAANPPLVLSLHSTRTRFLNQEICKDADRMIRLRKFSTMGSACTFPVQSLIFLGICLASIATKRRVKVEPTNVRFLAREVAVFGDDLIVPIDSRELLFGALELLHFKVNSSKSYWTGRFRESCGVDAMGGVDVTPSYWRSPYGNKPESTASYVETYNNFKKKFLVRTCHRLATAVPEGSVPQVTFDSGVCGMKSFARPDKPKLIRWNPDLQRSEARISSFITKQQRVPLTDDSALLQYFTEAPSPFHVWKGGVGQRPRLLRRSRWVPLTDLGFNLD
jgi:hypothetical protein